MGLQLQRDLAHGVGLYAFVSQARACDVAAQLLLRVATVGAEACRMRPLLWAHIVCLRSACSSSAPRSVITFCPVHQQKEMR